MATSRRLFFASSNDKEPFATEAHPFMTQDGWKKISELERNNEMLKSTNASQSEEINQLKA